MLLRPFENTEVKEALFSMFPDKAPGPDGMNPEFYQHYWDVVGGDVSDFVLNCLNSCSFPNGLNSTNVVLIPKNSVSENVSDLRPIALCNVVYKSAFIPDRLITDNILVAAEIGHYLNRKQCGVVGWEALKLDMAKAYDRMEWPFLRRMLEALGFDVRWVDLIMLCVSSVSYNFLIIGTPSGEVVPTRGLRQCDPLSPYLFIICAEGLSLLLQKAQAEGSIRGCRVARGASPVSHLFFADDSLLFFRANAQEVGAVKHCLDLYENMSGQAVNYHKSNVCFSINTQTHHREEVVAVLGVDQAPNFGKYMGLPAFVGRNKRAAFSYIEDKIKQRVGSWNKKLLSQAGKEILLKSVAHAMPTFSMSVFLLPESVCLSIERTMNRFWWGAGTKRRIHWKAWDRLCKPKKFGGLGFKDLRAFNLAMLGKQAWRFLLNPNSLVARIYKARYYPRTSFIDATIGSCPSYCWRSIMAAHDLICGGVRRRIGDGKDTLIWGHPWLPDGLNPIVQTPMPEQLNGSLVSGLIDANTGMWDIPILNDIFTSQDVLRISRIPISPGYEDSWYWHGDPKGCYTVKSGYRTILGDYSSMDDNFGERISMWKIKVPPKWKTFLWRALDDTLPVTTNLHLRRVDVELAYPKCGLSHENIMHALVSCEYSQHVWSATNLPIPSIVGVSFNMWFSSILYDLPEGVVGAVVAVLYFLWRARNSTVWEGFLPLPAKVVSAAFAALHAWREIHGGQPSVTSPVLSSTSAVPTLPTSHATLQHTQVETPRCYFDARFCSSSLKASFGAVLLSATGSFIAACAGPISSCFSPLMAEAVASKEALSWLRDRGVSNVAVFTDCSQLRSYLASASPVLSLAGFAIQTSRLLLSSFNSCVVSLVPISANVIAHTLAASAFSQITTLYWDSVPPNSISAQFD
ncbi:uncharacterized protein LOC116005640 [Ipomoea triloba]|uniref:uncharacterized protein LOC116005640 n=1 Tax=Ipomoea triloba TaxID=35885 RepID=UPI00125E6FF0|nr:uncharacterized protein LOC116005640 [Ipomoea triloba]